MGCCDRPSFDTYMQDLQSLSGVSEQEIAEAFQNAVNKDTTGRTKGFLASHALAQRRVTTTQGVDRAKNFDAEFMQLMSRAGGMGYGPRMRQPKEWYRHGNIDGYSNEGFLVTQSYHWGRGDIKLAADWEEKVLLPNATTLDGALNTMAVMGMS